MERIKEKGLKGLKYMERYTQTDMVYLAGGSFWLGIGQFVSSGSAFLTSIAFANLLPIESFGLYKYIISIVSLLNITALSGMDSALTQAVSRGYDGSLEPAVKEKMKWGTLGSLISLTISAYYFFNGNNTLAICFGLVSIFVPFSESLDIYNSLLLGKKLFQTQTIYNSIKKLIALVVIVATLFLTKNIFVILFVSLASFVIPNIYFLYRTRKYHKENNEVDPNTLKYGKHLSFMYVAGLVLAEVDKILIFHYAGDVSLAIYSLAMAPNDQIKGLLKNVNSLAMPQFSQNNPENIKKTIWNKLKILLITISLIVLAYITLANVFFAHFFPKYLESVKYSQLMSLSLIPIVLAGFLYTVLESQKATKELYKYNLYSNTVNLIVMVPLIYQYGLWGAIWSKIITRTFTFILSTKLVKNLS